MSDKLIIETLSKEVSDLKKALTDLEIQVTSRLDEIAAALATKS